MIRLQIKDNPDGTSRFPHGLQNIGNGGGRKVSIFSWSNQDKLSSSFAGQIGLEIDDEMVNLGSLLTNGSDLIFGTVKHEGRVKHDVITETIGDELGHMHGFVEIC